jgi:hypothetical protein
MTEKNELRALNAVNDRASLHNDLQRAVGKLGIKVVLECLAAVTDNIASRTESRDESLPDYDEVVEMAKKNKAMMQSVAKRIHTRNARN